MKITLIIPSCSSSRISLLIQTIESIQTGSYKDVHIVVVADGNQHLFSEVLKKGFDNLSIILNMTRMDWTFCINRVLKDFISEYYIYASDDLVFPADCIEKAMQTMEKCFPDGYGVVSIGRKTRAAFGLFGNKFVKHFPGRQVFCPDFIHYGGDSELFRVTMELGIETYPPDRLSQVRHTRKKDETWKLARRARSRDRAIYDKRQELGYKWGIDFNLVTKK